MNEETHFGIYMSRKVYGIGEEIPDFPHPICDRITTPETENVLRLVRSVYGNVGVHIYVVVSHETYRDAVFYHQHHYKNPKIIRCII